MFETLRNAWKIADLRKKILFTLFIILIFRVGAAIPVPFVHITTALVGEGDGFLNLLNNMTGGAFSYGTLFAMSVTPYINSSIIMQLLTVAIPALERLQKEGEEGRKKIASITRYVTVALGLLQSVAYYIYLRNNIDTTTNKNYLWYTDGFAGTFSAIVIVLCLTAGTALMMWLGEQINESGIGNGISILLFAGIVSRGRHAFLWLYNMFMMDAGRKILVVAILVVFLAIIGFIVWMDNAERRIPVQYAKRVVGRKMYGGQSSHIPIKVNMSGVLPIIFASSFLSLPGMIEMFLNPKPVAGTFWHGFFEVFKANNIVYAIVYFLFIIFFAYFYSSIQYNPMEMANNLRKNSGAIPGIRPGKPTSDYISKIMSRIVLLGALLISVVALLPVIVAMTVPDIAGISLGGTSVLILVGVALETMKQIESQMMMRHYKGFLE